MTSLERSNDWMIGMLRGVAIIAKYMKDCENNLLDVLLKPSRRETYLHGLFLRATFWMLTLEKLTTPRDIQAIHSCTRSMLEIAVDMTLLHCDKTDQSVQRMLEWDRSQKLQAAKPMVDYYEKKNLPARDVIKDVAEFVKTERASIETARLTLWNTPKHPRRWTGNRSLLEDVITADKLHGKEISNEFGMTLEEFYETEYRRLNWFVHGSGLMGVLKVEPEVYYWMCGVAFKWCSDLAMLCTKMILTDYGLAEHLPGLRDMWNKLELSRNLAYFDQVKTPLSQES